MDPQKRFGAGVADEILNARAEFMRFIDRVYFEDRVQWAQRKAAKMFGMTSWPGAVLYPALLSPEETAALKAKFFQSFMLPPGLLSSD